MRHYPAGGTARPMAPILRDLVCILCGTACTPEGTHVESWRDEGHLPLITQELEASPDARRVLNRVEIEVKR